MKFIISILLVALANFLGCCTAGPICDVIGSTEKIVGQLCYGNKGANRSNQQLIDQFFGCYDQAPGKLQFVTCQTSVFGGPLDNTQAVEKSCGNQSNLLPYGACLMSEFRKANLDMVSTVLKLNACQSRVMGIS